MNAPLTVLVIDDSSTVQRLLDLTLRPLGMRLNFAENGEDGVAMAYARHYDVIFLDVMLPGMDGYQVCKVIKRQARRRPIVIMLTSKDSAFDKVRGVMAGADVYMVKPLDRDRVIEAIKKHVRGATCLPLAATP